MQTDRVIVLAGHGSRSVEANDALSALAASVESSIGVPVRPAFLEMAEPSIPAVLAASAEAGAADIVLIPYFLHPGMHVRRDIVEIVDEARARLGIPIAIADFLGSHPRLPDLLVDLARRSLGAFPTGS